MAALALPTMRTRNSLRRTVDPSELPRMRVNDPTSGAPFVPPPDSTADERLSGEAGAEMAARELPTINPDALRRAQEEGVAPSPSGATAALNAPTADPDVLRRHYLELLQTPAEDTNGRGRSALRMLGQPVQPTDSVGNLIGQKIGQALSGLINPKSDEQAIDRPVSCRGRRPRRRARRARSAERARRVRRRRKSGPRNSRRRRSRRKSCRR
jgi:hypothetical protein